MLEHALTINTQSAAQSQGNRPAPQVNERTAGTMPVWGASADSSANAFGFKDLLDILNPLHHIPVLGSAYRELSGDTIKPAAQMIGSTLFGGPVGAVSSLANMVIQNETGHSAGDIAMAFASGKPIEQTPDVRVCR